MDQKNTKIDMAALEKAVKILKENELGELEYIANGIKIKVVSSPKLFQQAAVPTPLPETPPAETPPPPPAEATIEDLAKHPGALLSPMVGTCYLSPEPGAPSFVSVGDNVKQDQPLLIIEAMKVMNYIKAPKDGVVKNISVADATPVEFGQLLMVIE